ncbi:MAG: hypothetical protein ACR2GK_11725 [Gemmatimonadaceae bacterium]
MAAQDSRFPSLFALLEFVRPPQVARRLASVLMLAAAACTDSVDPVLPPASRIASVEGNNQFGLVGLALAKPLSVKLTDSFLNPIAGVPVRFDVVAGGGAIAGETATTSAAGIATSGAWTLGSLGPQQVRARSQGTEVVFDALACASIAWGCDAPEAAQSVIIFVRGVGTLFRSAVDNPKPVQITSDGSYAKDPEWSPDGSRVAFTRSAQNRSDIYIIRAGGELTPRTTDGNYYDPTWSPDGRQLAVAKSEPMGFGIYVMSADADGKPPLRLAAGIAPAWSPDGLRIAFGNNGGSIDRVNADGTGLTSLLSRSNGRGFHQPAWSPDGRSIAVTVTSNCDDDDCDYAIGVLDPGATDVRLIVRGLYGRSWVSEPTWSPDGSTIAFTKGLCEITGCSQSVSAINLDLAPRASILGAPHSRSTGDGRGRYRPGGGVSL